MGSLTRNEKIALAVFIALAIFFAVALPWGSQPAPRPTPAADSLAWGQTDSLRNNSLIYFEILEQAIERYRKLKHIPINQEVIIVIDSVKYQMTWDEFKRRVCR